MIAVPWRIRRAWPALLGLLSLAVLTVLARGRAPYPVHRLRWNGSALTFWLILLLVAVLAGIAARTGRISLAAFRGREAHALFCGLLVIYLANGEGHPTGDTVPARYLPLSVLREGNLDFDEFAFLRRDGPLYSLTQVKGRWVSTYPIGTALLAVPLYLPSALGTIAADSAFLLELEKLAAAAIVAASAAVLYLALRGLTDPRMALILTALYGLGTSSLSSSSQALWQHGGVQLSLASAIYGLVRARTDPRWLAGVGLALAFAVVCRPGALVMVVPLGVHAVLSHRGAAWRLAAGGALPALFQLWYNTSYFGDPFRTQFAVGDPWHWSTPLGDGLAGVLLSPARGLLVYSPIFVLCAVGMARAWWRGGDPLLRAVSVGVVGTVLLYAKWVAWWGGSCYGPRFLADILPGLILLLLPLRGLLAGRRGLRAAFACLAAWSLFAHAVGAFWQDGNQWSGNPNVDRFADRLWAWEESPPALALREAWTRARILGGLPTSRSRPGLLASSLTVTSSWPARPSMDVAVTAVNDGQAVWLARGQGEVVLAWRWRRGDEDTPIMDYRPMLRSVPPGGSYRFIAMLDRDPAWGESAEIGLVVIRRGRPRWFASVPLAVARTGDVWRHAAAELLVGGLAPQSTAVRAGPVPWASVIVGDQRVRAGSLLRVGLDVANPGGGPSHDVHAGVLLPDGRSTLFFLAPAGFSPPVPGTAPERFVRLREIRGGATIREPAFLQVTVPAAAPPGSYGFFVAVTRSGSLASGKLAPGDVLALDVRTMEITP